MKLAAFAAKRNAVLALAALTCLGMLTGCGSRFSAADLVQSNLDLIYLDQYTEEYLRQVSCTEEEAEALYTDGIAVEVDYFADRFDIDLDACDATIAPQLSELFHQIYSHSRYEVGESRRADDGYEVALTIYPIDIIQKVSDEDVDDYLDRWQARGEAGEFAEMDEQQFETAWAQGIIDMVYARVDSIGYLEAQAITVHVVQDAESGRYSIDSEDFQAVDALMIAY